MRRPLIAGNWKMYKTVPQAVALVDAILSGLKTDTEVVVAPPFTALHAVAALLRGRALALAGQNMQEANEGAFTGEISPVMLRDVGCTHVILGHSERRHVYGESDERVNAKVQRALEAGLEVILCVGETLDERTQKKTEAVVSRQLTRGLEGVTRDRLARITIAYEPVWAIGTGHNATPEQASAVHQYLRGLLSGLYEESAEDEVRIQYGGSVNPGNARAILAADDVDGALVGGASLKLETFLPIIDSSRRS